MFSVFCSLSLLYIATSFCLILKNKSKALIYGAIAFVFLMVFLLIYHSVFDYSKLVAWKSSAYLSIFSKGAFEEFAKLFAVFLIIGFSLSGNRSTFRCCVAFSVIIATYENITSLGGLYLPIVQAINHMDLSLLDGLIAFLKEQEVQSIIALGVFQILRIFIHSVLLVLTFIFIKTKNIAWAVLPLITHGTMNTASAYFSDFQSQDISYVLPAGSVMALILFVLIMFLPKKLKLFLKRVILNGSSYKSIKDNKVPA